METQTVMIENIRADESTQSREGIYSGIVEEYAERIDAGEEFPPLVVFYDGASYWLADGFHRLLAYRKLGRKDVICEVREGTKRDAILYGVGANANHGVRRSNADKRRAVMMLLEDSEWSKWSNAEIARRCNVSDMLVARICGSLQQVDVTGQRLYTTKHGTTAVMNTAGIGKTVDNLLALAQKYAGGENPQATDGKIAKPAPDGKAKEATGDTTPTRAMKLEGCGIEWAGMAINALEQIPLDDPLRTEGLEIVKTWCEDNRSCGESVTGTSDSCTEGTDGVWRSTRSAAGGVCAGEPADRCRQPLPAIEATLEK